MTYEIIAKIAMNDAIRPRLIACAAEQGKPKPYENWVDTHRWDLAILPDWVAAWEYAELQGPGMEIGLNPQVITDQMMLSAIQPMQ